MRIGILSTGSLVLAGLTALALGAASPAAAEDLTVVSWGGAYQASQREAFFKPFAKDTGNKIIEEEYNGEIAKIRAMVEAKQRHLGRRRRRHPQTALAGLRRRHPRDDRLGQARPRPLEVHRRRSSTNARVPNDPLFHGHRLRQGQDCRTGRRRSPISSICRNSPASAALQKNPFVNLEWALIADGVRDRGRLQGPGTPGRRRSRLQEARYDQEGCRLVGGRRPAAAAARRRPGRHDLGLERPYLQRRQDDKQAFRDHVGCPGPGLGLVGDPEGRAEARRRLQVHRLSRAQPDAQADQTKYISYGPANKDAIPNIDPAIAAGPADGARQHEQRPCCVDPQFWADKGEELRERFNAWLAQ